MMAHRFGTVTHRRFGGPSDDAGRTGIGTPHDDTVRANRGNGTSRARLPISVDT